MEFFDWEGRPAVVNGNSAWAIVSEGGAWESVRVEEVIESGAPLLPETFDAMFPDAGLPPNSSSN